jgi:hypothetical protein
MYCIVANVRSEKGRRAGPKVYILVCKGDFTTPEVSSLDKSGRTTVRHLPFTRLTNFRAGTVSERHRERFHPMWLWDDKQGAETVAEILSEKWPSSPPLRNARPTAPGKSKGAEPRADEGAGASSKPIGSIKQFLRRLLRTRSD